MVEATLLVELLTEELPPKSLARLGEVFGKEVVAGLAASHLASANTKYRWFATPRRVAVLIEAVLDSAPDRTETEKIMPVAVALDAEGNPSIALKKKLAARKIPELEIQFFSRRMDGKTETFFYQLNVIGDRLDVSLPIVVETALKRLPVSKMMRWGSGEAQFVRPVHGLVMLHGSRIVPGTVLGLQSSNKTRGHRFMGKSDITLAGADSYEKQLQDEGMVVADFNARKSAIDAALQAEAKRQGGSLGEYAALLDEVAALVEHPSVYVGEFDRAFLEVPQECLILTMRQNQKYFPLFDAEGKLRPKFLIVSNMKVADPRHIVGGNQRVVRPRLEDARFFYNQDRKQRLEERVALLDKVVYHNKLGTQHKRMERVRLLAGKIARVLGADPLLAERAAELAKADLLTGMVGEFPELQGVMGRYYAIHDGEPAEVADAIEAHYRPRFAGDRLPEGKVACAVALADKLDAIAGLFSIGQQPTGDKDPFGLRRAALGVVRILVENRLHLSILELAKAACEPFASQTPVELVQFVYDRFAGYLKEQGYSSLQVDSVLSKNPTGLSVVPLQLEAVKAFQALPEAESLTAANKRIANILKQAEAKGETPVNAALNELPDPADRALHEAIHAASEKAKPLYDKGDYTGYLKSFAALKAPVDTFFEKVMVMDKDDKVRRNRLALLRDLREAMNRVADLSRLAA